MDATGKQLCEQAKQLWRMYLVQSMRDPQRLASHFVPDCIVVGTGRHEFYETADDFLSALAADFEESSEMDFKVVDEWYQAQLICEKSYLVYGGIHVHEDTKAGEPLVDMDTRFTMVFRREPDGAWKVAHIHHSLPYLDQMAGEYYPRSLSERASQAMEFADRMRELARRDQMTSLLNHTAFFNDAQEALETSSDWWIFVMDVDDFKTVNDERGHLTGDEVIIALARTLRSHAGEGDVVGRVGGDEFAALVRLESRIEAEELAYRIERDFGEAVARELHVAPGLSVGFVPAQGMDVQSSFAKADRAMYAVKSVRRLRA